MVPMGRHQAEVDIYRSLNMELSTNQRASTPTRKSSEGLHSFNFLTGHAIAMAIGLELEIAVVCPKILNLGKFAIFTVPLERGLE